MMDFNRKEKYSIYIGLLDKKSYEEVITVGEFKKILEEYCSVKKIAFSLSVLRGGYTHSKGYAIENSLLIELIGADYDTVKKMAFNLKSRINTDAVLITREYIESAII